MIRGTNLFHEPLHGPDTATRSEPVDGRGHPECAAQRLETRRPQAMDHNYSRLGRPLIRGGAPRALLDALVEPQLGLVTEGTAGTSRSNEPGLIRLGGRPNAAAG